MPLSVLVLSILRPIVALMIGSCIFFYVCNISCCESPYFSRKSCWDAWLGSRWFFSLVMPLPYRSPAGKTGFSVQLLAAF